MTDNRTANKDLSDKTNLCNAQPDQTARNSKAIIGDHLVGDSLNNTAAFNKDFSPIKQKLSL